MSYYAPYQCFTGDGEEAEFPMYTFVDKKETKAKARDGADETKNRICLIGPYVLGC